MYRNADPHPTKATFKHHHRFMVVLAAKIKIAPCTEMVNGYKKYFAIRCLFFEKLDTLDLYVVMAQT